MSVKIEAAEFITCARCCSVRSLADSNYTVYATKEAALHTWGWLEFADKAEPYLLCRDCTFSRKHQRLLAMITNMLATTISAHPFLKKLDEHDMDACELCRALQRAILVTDDFKNYVKDRPLFAYTENPPKKSTFDDSYDVLFDPELASLVKPLQCGCLLTEICDNAHDMPINRKANLLDKQTGKNKFCLPKIAKLPKPSVAKYRYPYWSKLIAVRWLVVALLLLMVLLTYHFS